MSLLTDMLIWNNVLLGLLDLSDASIMTASNKCKESTRLLLLKTSYIRFTRTPASSRIGLG